MFHQPSLPTARKPNRKKIHQHHESKKWARLPANEKCLECYPVRKLFLETAFGKLPPEIRADLFKMVLTVGSLSPLKYGISVPMAKPQRVPHPQLTRCPARPASCLALLQTCRQIHRESSLLFYAINTLYLSNPQDMLSFLRHLGPTRIGEIRSLHLEDVFVQMPMWRQGQLDTLRSQGLVSEDILASFASERGDMMNPDAENAIKQLNKCGKLRKMYLDMRPSQTLAYIKLCLKIPALENSEIVFASPTRWSVMLPSTIPSTTKKKRSWLFEFLRGLIHKPQSEWPHLAYWRGNEKYRVEVDVFPAFPERRITSTDSHRSVDVETRDGSGVDTAMEGLSLS